MKRSQLIVSSILQCLSYHELDNIFVRFSNLGDNFYNVLPTQSFKTPYGICAYPADFILKNQNTLFNLFAGSRDQVHIFSADNFFDMSKKYNNNISSIVYDTCEQLQLNPDYELKYATCATDAYLVIQNVYLKSLGYGPNSKEKRNPNKILADIFQQSGFTGIVDRGSGTIHMNEPHQAIFFNINNLKLLNTIQL